MVWRYHFSTVTCEKEETNGNAVYGRGSQSDDRPLFHLYRVQLLDVSSMVSMSPRDQVSNL